MGRARGIAVIGLALAAIALICVPQGGTAGNVPPSFTDPLVVAAVAAAGFQGQNAYLQVISESQSLKIQAFASGPNIGLRTGWANATNATPRLSTLASATTWINVTQTCGARTCPGASIDCDGVFIPNFFSPPSFKVTRPCWHLAPLFNNQLFPAAGDQAPNFTVTRLDTYLTVQGTQWFKTSGSQESIVANVSVIEARAYGVNVTAYSGKAVAWAIPYPAGNWNPALTQVKYTNLSQTVTSFSQTPQDIVLRWNGIPTGVQNYTVAVFGSPGGSFGQGYGNQTVPATLVLQAGNITNIGSGTYEASVTWTNPFGVPFTGQVQLTGSWVSTAISTTVTVNAQPVQSVWTSTAVTLTAGTLNVTNGSTVNIKVDYQLGSTFSFTQPAFTFNGLPVTYLLLVGIAGIVAFIIVSFIDLTQGIRSLAMAITAIGLLTGLGWVWLAL